LRGLGSCGLGSCEAWVLADLGSCEAWVLADLGSCRGSGPRRPGSGRKGLSDQGVVCGSRAVWAVLTAVAVHVDLVGSEVPDRQGDWTASTWAGLRHRRGGRLVTGGLCGGAVRSLTA
jgi:hypothetical protein